MNWTAATDALQRHHRALSLAGVALLVVGAWLAASAYSAPYEERIVSRQSAWSETAAFTYAVPITRNSTHYPEGTVLAMGEPAYFRTVTDSILVEHAWSMASSDPDARGVAAGTLVVRIAAQTADGRPYWSIEHPLAQVSTDDVTTGLILAGALELDALVDEVSTLSRELPVTDGTVNWTVRAHVVYSIDAAGRREQGETERILPLKVSDPRFELPPAAELTWKVDHDQESVTVIPRIAGPAGVLRSWPSLALVAIAALLLVAGQTAARAPEGEPFEREMRRFREWVSTAGRIPDHSAHPSSTVDVRSLEDLIHVAADARTRVVLDERSRVFYAFLPGVTYRYARHAF